jgi:hypothetical protein
MNDRNGENLKKDSGEMNMKKGNEKGIIIKKLKFWTRSKYFDEII